MFFTLFQKVLSVTFHKPYIFTGNIFTVPTDLSGWSKTHKLFLHNLEHTFSDLFTYVRQNLKLLESVKYIRDFLLSIRTVPTMLRMKLPFLTWMVILKLEISCFLKHIFYQTIHFMLNCTVLSKRRPQPHKFVYPHEKQVDFMQQIY